MENLFWTKKNSSCNLGISLCLAKYCQLLHAYRLPFTDLLFSNSFCVFLKHVYFVLRASLVIQMVNNLPAMQETKVQSQGQEDPLEKRNSYPLQYSCLKNSMYRRVWQTTVHGVSKSQARLSQ